MLDPSRGVQERLDLGLKDGVVVESARGLSPDRAEKTIDADGRLVSPGFVDLHVHVFPGVSHYGIDADRHCVRKGATTVLDAGSAGADTFAGFRRYVIEVSETRIRALLNISATGMISRVVGELEDIRNADPQRAIDVCEKNRDVIVGIKVRLSRFVTGNNAMVALQRARQASEALKMPMMVHVGELPPGQPAAPIAQILAQMRKGDVLTHCFTGLANGILGKDGMVIPEAREAMKRGVNFDVGHGQGSFSFKVARDAMSQGIEPNTISSDLHRYNTEGPVFDLATTASKFLHLGMPLERVISKVTNVPAEFLGLAGAAGTLRPGAFGDVVVLDEEEGEFQLEDTVGVKEVGRRMLRPVCVLKGGKVIVDNLGSRGSG